MAAEVAAEKDGSGGGASKTSGKGIYDHKRAQEDRRAPRTLHHLKLCKHKVDVGDTFESRWDAEIAVREKGEMENRLLRVSGMGPDGKHLRSGASVCKFGCDMHKHCKYLVIVKKSGTVWSVDTANGHTCRKLSKEKFIDFVEARGRGRAKSNYSKHHLASVIRHLVEASVQSKSGGTRSKRKLMDIPCNVLTSQVSLYTAAELESNAVQSIKDLAFAEMVKPDEELSVRGLVL